MTSPTAPLTPLAAYPLHLPVFEGPLDLLLYLIRKQELEIKDIPIARITEQYTAYLKAMEELNLDVASEYVLLAATLIHIKSKMLLPRLPLDEEGNPEDPRQELVDKLLEYERFKRSADELHALETARERIHTRAENVLERYPGAGDGIEAGLFDLVRAFEDVLARRTGDERVLEAEEYRVEDKCQAIRLLLAERGTLSFNGLLRACRSILEALTTFVALLELVRRGGVRAHQGSAFGEILIYSTDGPLFEEAQEKPDAAA
jgi:segregation and condensation protein A